MKTVFLSGSRRIRHLDEQVRGRLQTIADDGDMVVVGDAGGADTAFQRYFADAGYRNVTVYCSGNECRNNVGGWDTHNVETAPNIKGRAFYAVKDRAMAAAADYGLILWDGKSLGSITNALELVTKGKHADVYFAPGNEFYTLSTIEDLNKLLDVIDAATRNKLIKDLNLQSDEPELPGQMELLF